MYTQIRYLLLPRRQEFQQFDYLLHDLPIGRTGSASRRVVLDASSIEEVANRYRLVPLEGDQGDGSPIRAFRAYPRPHD